MNKRRAAEPACRTGRGRTTDDASGGSELGAHLALDLAHEELDALGPALDNSPGSCAQK
jgi:hypothetical protein